MCVVVFSHTRVRKSKKEEEEIPLLKLSCVSTLSHATGDLKQKKKQSANKKTFSTHLKSIISSFQNQTSNYQHVKVKSSEKKLKCLIVSFNN